VLGRSVVAAVGCAALIAVTVTATPAGAARGDATNRVSVATGGAQSNEYSCCQAISADGRYLAFRSDATNLVAGDTNVQGDVFVRDEVTGATTRISGGTGTAQANEHSHGAAISADGRYVSYASLASNLVAGDTSGVEDVFVHDRTTGATTRVSVATGGAQGNAYSGSGGSAISADGRYVSFVSAASNLVAGDTNGSPDVFVHDRTTGATTRVSVASNGTEGDDYSWNTPTLSADGRYVAFFSSSSNLVAGDTNDMMDVFVHDRTTGATTRVSVATGGAQGNNHSNSTAWAISADGRYVTFTSFATNLVAGDTSTASDVFVHDRTAGTTTRISAATSGTQGNNTSNGSVISADGRYVAFSSEASNLVAADTNVQADVFTRDRTTGATTRVSVSNAGDQEADSSSYAPTISADGRYVAFTSDSTNLVAGDTNGTYDVFVRDRLTQAGPGVAAVTRLSDFNRDGVTDLVARDTSGRLWLYPGNGSGGFGSRRQMGVGWNGITAILTPGDVTGDGNADVLGRDTAGRLSLYPGNGASAFLSRRQVGSGWNIMTSVTDAANLNGAGRPDVIARDTTGALWLYPLVGNGVFGARSRIGSGWNGYTILGPGDASGDGRTDILARDTTGSLQLYPGSGTGLVGRRTTVSAGWTDMTDLVTPGNWDRSAGNDLLARDGAGALWLCPGDNAGSLGAPRQIGSGWQGMTYIG
jgi:FG-GAP-like repeat/WD40-like Beta Propeller Repeat